MSVLVEITSKDNPKIQKIAKLQTSARYRKETGLFAVEGLRVCDDCVDNGVEIEMLVIADGFYNIKKNTLEKYISVAKETIIVKDYLFEKIADTKNPQGILAVGKTPKNTALSIKSNGRYIALENIADPSNLGAISRTAEAIGIDGIIVSATGCDPYSPKVLRASMGTVLRMNIIIAEEFTDTLKNSGLKLYGCVVKGGKDIRKAEFCDGSIVIIGNEANGLTEEVKQISENITIPMSGSAESLNAAAAAAIALWELKR